MGVYIKGMEMPTNDEMLCIKIYPNGKVAIDMDLECKQIATAVPVPAHGRLIDADALVMENYKQYGAIDDLALEVIKAAPTIIQAEEGK